MLEWAVRAPLYEDAWILAFDKPSGLNTAPLPSGGGPDLLTEVVSSRPEVSRAGGRKPWEPGLVHRLDRGTSGVVLFARGEAAMTALLGLQEGDALVKEYLALCVPDGRGVEGSRPLRGEADPSGAIRSRFRPYGPKGARVAAMGEPVPWPGRLYETRIIERTQAEGRVSVRAALTRGYRHQVRAHLAWTGTPIMGDALYGGPEAERLMLHAFAVEFIHPFTGESLRIECPPPPGFGRAA